jgi:hypothetical protein
MEIERRRKNRKRRFLPDVRHADRQKTRGPGMSKGAAPQAVRRIQKNRKWSKADDPRKKLCEAERHCRSPPDGKIDPGVAGTGIEFDLPGDFPVAIEYSVEQIFRKGKRHRPRNMENEDQRIEIEKSAKGSPDRESSIPQPTRRWKSASNTSGRRFCRYMKSASIAWSRKSR